MEKKKLTRTGEFLELLGESIAGVPKLTVSGGNHALVENYRRLVKYSRELIEIDGGKLTVRIQGEGMEIVSMRREDIMVAGHIFSADFEWKGAGAWTH